MAQLTLGTTIGGQMAYHTGNIPVFATRWPTLSEIGAAAAVHVHAISSVTGLQAALDGKSAVGHIHTIANVTGLQAALDGKSAVGHVHAIANVTGLQSALDGKALKVHKHAIADVNGLQPILDTIVPAAGGSITSLWITKPSAVTDFNVPWQNAFIDSIGGANAPDSASDSHWYGITTSSRSNTSAKKAGLQLVAKGGTDKVYIRTRGEPGSGHWNRMFTDTYHPNADKLTTARTVSFSGDVSGSLVFDGSSNKSVVLTVADDSHNHVIGNVDGLQNVLNSKADAATYMPRTSDVAFSWNNTASALPGHYFHNLHQNSVYVHAFKTGDGSTNTKFEWRVRDTVDTYKTLRWGGDGILTGPLTYRAVNAFQSDRTSGAIVSCGGNNNLLGVDTSKGAYLGSTNSYIYAGKNGVGPYYNGHRIFHKGYLPTAVEVGAFPETGGTVSGDLTVSQNLQVGGYIAAGLCVTKTHEIPSTEHGHVVKLYVGDTVWGELDVFLTSTWGQANVSGYLQYRYSIGLNPEGAKHHYSQKVIRTENLTSSAFAIGEFEWDSTLKQWYLPVYHHTGPGNRACVVIRGIMNSTANVANIASGTTSAPIAYEDATIKKQYGMFDGMALDGDILNVTDYAGFRRDKGVMHVGPVKGSAYSGLISESFATGAEVSTRLFFSEDNTKNYGVAFEFNGAGPGSYPHTGMASTLDNGQWALTRQANSSVPAKIMWGTRSSSEIHFGGQIIAEGFASNGPGSWKINLRLSSPGHQAIAGNKAGIGFHDTEGGANGSIKFWNAATNSAGGTYLAQLSDSGFTLLKGTIKEGAATVYTTARKPSLSALGAFPVAGGTITGLTSVNVSVDNVFNLGTIANKSVVFNMTEDAGKQGAYFSYAGSAGNEFSIGTISNSTKVPFLAVARGSKDVTIAGAILTGVVQSSANNSLTRRDYVLGLVNSKLNTSGGSLTGDVTFTSDHKLRWSRNTDYAEIYFKNASDADTDSYMHFKSGDNQDEYFKWSNAAVDWMTLKADGLRIKGNLVFHAGNLPTWAQVTGKPATFTPSAHTHSGFDVKVLGNKLAVADGGTLAPSATSAVTAGMYGLHSTSRIGHIWSIGTQYKINAAGTDFGTIFGFAYKHVTNTTAGTMAGGHMGVWCQNGVPFVALGDNLWVKNNIMEFSDIRVKNDLVKIDNALDRVKQINGYTYIRIDSDSDKRQAGVIAQEVIKVLPEVVSGGPTEDDPDNKYSVAYGNMVALLIEAVKELSGKVDTLEKRLGDQY